MFAGLSGRAGGTAALAIVGLLFSSAPARACTRTWVAGTGDWATASNWSPPMLPGVDDDVCLPASATYVVTLAGIAGATVRIRTLTVGGDGTGTVTLQLSGGIPPPLTPGADVATLAVSANSKIGANGAVVLATTPTESAAFSGGMIDNAGTIAARSPLTNPLTSYLRGPVINEPTGTLHVEGGDLTYDSGSLFQNLGAIVADSTGYLLFSTEPGLSSTSTQIINRGSVSDYGNIGVRDGTWTQAGGSEATESISVENGLLDDQGGRGRFYLTGSQLSGTISPDQTISADGSLHLSGAVVTNHGTLIVHPGQGPLANQVTVVDGAQIDNTGSLVIDSANDSTAHHTVALRTDVHNSGVLRIDDVWLLQDVGTMLDSSGTVDISSTAQYALWAGPTSRQPSTFVNVAPGIVEFELRPTSSGRILLGPGSAMTADGALVAQAQGFRLHRQARYDVIQSTGGSLEGDIGSTTDGFVAFEPSRNSLSLVFGQLVRRVIGGTLAFSLIDNCPAGANVCRLTVRATATHRVSTWLRDGPKRRRGTRAVTTTVAVGRWHLSPGEERVVMIPINARGRALLARTGHAHAIVVTALSGTRTILRASVTVRP